MTKKIKFKKTISEITIVNNKKLAPYIELANFSSTNIDQEKLGTILGIFEIKETSEDSAYIVNFLSSVIKKTYFANSKKTAEESFEATLERLNLTLSEVANHGNINWIGKLDAILCAFTENEINFTVSGDAKVLLLRNGNLSEISQGLSPKDEAINPMKTFTDIASGQLEEKDKIVLTTGDIFHILDLPEIEKYANNLAPKKFVRFLKTALVNELSIAGVTVIDIIKEKITPTPAVSESKTKKITNAFGADAFKDSTAKKRKNVNTKIQTVESKKSSKKDYVNEKTGHIYIKDSTESDGQYSDQRWENFAINIKDNCSHFFCKFKNVYLKKINYRFNKTCRPAIKKFFLILLNTIKSSFYATGSMIKTIANRAQKKTVSIISGRKIPRPNVASHYKKISSVIVRARQSKILSRPSFIQSFFNNARKVFTNATVAIYKFIIPSFSKIKLKFDRLSRKEKLIAIGIIVIIIVAPMISIKNKNDLPSQDKSANNEIEKSDSNKINPSDENYHTEITSIYKNDDLIGVVTHKNFAYAITKNKVVALNDDENKEFSLPDNFGEIKLYTFMSDLNLLFLMDEKSELISFSPISKKFQRPQIQIPENANILAIGTYLTYLYIVDANHNQIYRYPRAEGGFGEKIAWLKDSSVQLKETKAMTIDGNIFILKNNNTLIKLFEKKKIEFLLSDNSDTKLQSVFTTNDIDNLYLADIRNGEIVEFNKNGERQKYVSNQEITNAQNIWINDSNKKIYFTTDNTLFEINTKF